MANQLCLSVHADTHRNTDASVFCFPATNGCCYAEAHIMKIVALHLAFLLQSLMYINIKNRFAPAATQSK